MTCHSTDKSGRSGGYKLSSARRLKLKVFKLMENKRTSKDPEFSLFFYRLEMDRCKKGVLNQFSVASVIPEFSSMIPCLRTTNETLSNTTDKILPELKQLLH